jgi:hypothetical protein
MNVGGKLCGLQAHCGDAMKSTLCLVLAIPFALSACTTEPPPATAKVFKSDGSVQCSQAGTSVEDMQRELTGAGIDVICGQKANDGSGYCAACGCGTGMINVYTIHPENIQDAEALGFAPVTDLPDYQDQPCPR